MKESSEEKTTITIDRVLQTVGGILLLLCTFIMSWGGNRLVAHENEITKHSAEIASLKEMVSINDRRTEKKLDEIAVLLKELATKIDQRNSLAR